LIEKIKPKSEFSRNVLTLITGTTIAQAIPIGISPILTRLYTPRDFGVFALFTTIVYVFGNISNGRYELSIMLPRKDEDAINIVALGFIINILITLSLFIIIYIFHENILNLLNNRDISPWLYLIPISVFLMGCFNLLRYFNNRKKFYRDLAEAKVYKSIGMAIVQLSLGFFKAGAIGLISGHIFSQIISNTKLFINIKKLNLHKKIKRVKILAFARKYKKLPIFNLPNVLIDGIRVTAINILITKLFSISTLGYFSLSLRVVQTPMSIIGGSISEIFFQRVSISKDREEIKRLVISFLKRATLISLPIFILIYLFSKPLFKFIFGDEWEIAGEIASIMTPWFFLNFLTSPLSTIFIKLNRQEILLIFSIFYTLVPIVVLLLSKNLELLKAMEYLSISMSITLSIFIGIVFFYLKNGDKK